MTAPRFAVWVKPGAPKAAGAPGARGDALLVEVARAARLDRLLSDQP